MDKRIEKTKHSLYNAFIEIRSKKSLERISVKELCELANINKSTFYAYYLDIFDLSDRIEGEITAEIMKEVNIDDLIENPANLPKQLSLLLTSKQSLISIIFSGSRTQELPKKILCEILNQLRERHSDYANNERVKILLTYGVYGGYYAFNENKNSSEELVIKTLGEISERLNLKFDQ